MESKGTIDKAIVIDNGSGYIKAGISGELVPKSVFQSVVGYPKQKGIMVGTDFCKTFIGDEVIDKRSVIRAVRPINRGVIENWQEMQKIWQHIFYRDLKKSPEEYKIFMTEPPLNSRQNRETMAEILFEEFKIPYFFIGIQTVLALYTTGRKNGVVLDSGYGLTHCIPIYEGYALEQGIRVQDFAGQDVDEFLLEQMKDVEGYSKEVDLEYIRQMKEKFCFIDQNPLQSKANYEEEQKYIFNLPDDTKLNLSTNSFTCPEIMFNPSIINKEYQGIHEMINDSIKSCDKFLQTHLYPRILLAGGNTMFNGMQERVKLELQKLAPASVEIDPLVLQENPNAAWIGGSIMAELSTFESMCICQKDFKEDPNIIHKKCFG